MAGKLVKRALALGAVATLGTLAAPDAQALAVGGGQVSGTVHVTPGVAAVVDCQPDTFTFDSVVLNGSVVIDGHVFAGSITTSNVHGQGCDAIHLGQGTVNSPGDPAYFTGSGAGGQSLNGTFYGTFTRVGLHVVVNLTGTMTACGPTGCAHVPSVPINIEASEFIPTGIDASSTRTTDAAFTGAFRIG